MPVVLRSCHVPVVLRSCHVPVVLRSCSLLSTRHPSNDRPVPNGKYDMNNCGAISSDMIGGR